MDAEVLVIDDGSTDRTGAIVAALAETHLQVRLITHATNQGYGAALASGFAAATAETCRLHLLGSRLNLYQLIPIINVEDSACDKWIL